MRKHTGTIIIIILIFIIGVLSFALYKKGKGKVIYEPPKSQYRNSFESYNNPGLPKGVLCFKANIIYADGKKPAVKSAKENNYWYPGLLVELKFPKLSTMLDGSINPDGSWIATIGPLSGDMPQQVEINFKDPGYKTFVCRLPIRSNVMVLPDIVMSK